MFVYFIRETVSGAVKVGLSYDPEKRLVSLQAANPNKLELLGVILGGRAKEMEFHARYRHLHIGGEWYRLSPEDLPAFRDPKKPLKPKRSPRKSVKHNLSVLAAISEMVKAGKHRSEICPSLRISQTTYYRCLEQIEGMRERGQARA